jgi:hypothetical protein
LNQTDFFAIDVEAIRFGVDGNRRFSVQPIDQCGQLLGVGDECWLSHRVKWYYRRETSESQAGLGSNCVSPVNIEVDSAICL